MASGHFGGCNFGFELDSSLVVLFWKGEHLYSVLLYIWFQSSLGRKSKHSCSTLLFCCLLRSLGNCRLWVVGSNNEKKVIWMDTKCKQDWQVRPCILLFFEDTEDSNPTVLHDGLARGDVPLYHVWLQMMKSSEGIRTKLQHVDSKTQTQKHDDSNIPT